MKLPVAEDVREAIDIHILIDLWQSQIKFDIMCISSMWFMALPSLNKIKQQNKQ